MTDKPKAERPAAQPGTPLNAICLNCKMPFSDHQASKEPHCPKGHWEWADTVFAAEVYRVAEALASQWKECPKCHQPVSGPHECYNSVLNGEAPAQIPGTDDVLLPCPFCGGPAYYTESVNGSRMVYVGCSVCGIAHKAEKVYRPGGDYLTKDVKAAWNKRALSSAASSPEPASKPFEDAKDDAKQEGFRAGLIEAKNIADECQAAECDCYERIEAAAIRAKASATQFPIDKTDDWEARQDAKASAEKGESDAS
jgi:hypothetical protein